jgi:GT2 family glycosyltransferase
MSGPLSERPAAVHDIPLSAARRRAREPGRTRYIGADLDQVLDVEVVAGCFMLVRRQLIEEVGGMDEGFFMYGEEAEWCFRIRRAGWSILYFPGATILHRGGESARQYADQMTLAMSRSQLLFIQKTEGRAAAYLANLLMLLRDLPRALAWLCFSAFPRLRQSGVTGLLRPSVARVWLHIRGVFRPDWSHEA